MGWRVKVPVPDERMLDTMEKIGLTEKDLKTLFTKFCKFDNECSKSGSIDLSEFYRSFREKESAFGNAIFSLIDCDNSGQLDFSEYVAALSTFCVLGRDEVLKFCFFVFDDDKNGTIEGNELDALLELLHSDGQSSNIKTALESFGFNSDGKIDFSEFQALNQQFPSLLYPAFRMQENMRRYTLGNKWWEKKISEMGQERQKKALQGEEARLLREKKKKTLQLTLLKKKMGCFKYYLCPCRRNRYIVEDSDEEEENEELDEETKRQQAEALRRVQEAEKKDQKRARKEKNKNTSKVGKRKPLTKDERAIRARNRRCRDMKDRPGRK